MEIMQVVSDLVATRRVDQLFGTTLRVVRDSKNRLSVAVDAVSTRPGDWVITVATSAARHATGKYSVTTDLTIAGIIDYWDDAEEKIEQKDDDKRDEGTQGGRSRAA